MISQQKSEDNHSINQNSNHKSTSSSSNLIPSSSSQKNQNSNTQLREFNDKCSICNDNIYSNKYICCICYKLILCENCQKEHFHPLLKCKYSDISSLVDVYKFLSKTQLKDAKEQKYFDGYWDDKFILKLSTSVKKFTMRPNKKLSITIEIENQSEVIREPNADRPFLFTLVSRDIKDLIVHETEVNHQFREREKIERDVLIESGTNCGKYSFIIELYSQNTKFEANWLCFNLEVNEDKIEEELNEFLVDYPKLFVLSKDNKKWIKNMIEQNLTSKNPEELGDLLMKCNYDIQVAKKKLFEN